jgi:putative membrane protein
MASAERVLTTPLPAGYNILISQIVLLYVYLLPFQLVTLLGWITVPATVAAAYMIIGLAAIGHELEDPFGNDVNDLPLDHYCDELRRELDVLTSREKMTFSEMMKVEERHNRVLWPLSMSGHDEWRQRKVQDIRSALKAKVVVGQTHKQGRTASEASGKSSGASSGISSGVMV